MNENRSFASLSSKLLARKGAARPAMRPQLQSVQVYRDSLARAVPDDLGWNDMGEDADFNGESPALPEAFDTPAPPEDDSWNAAVAGHDMAVPAPQDFAPPAAAERESSADVVPISVAALQEAIAERLATPVASRQPARKSRRSALAEGRRAAFTLRLDAERHLKLRLAATLGNRSAQVLLIDALDRLLADDPKISDLAEHVKTKI